MHSILDLIILEPLNEHDFEHILNYNKNFTTPKINDYNGDLKSRWYVYFSYKNPKTGKMQRMNNIYGGANRYKTKAERYSVLRLYKKRLEYFLNRGYNPFGDNSNLHEHYLEQKQKIVQVVNEGNTVKENNIKNTASKPIKKSKKITETKSSLTVDAAFEKAIELKTNVVGTKTLEDYKTRLKSLKRWLKKEHKAIKYIDDIEKKHILQYLNEVQLKSSARNRNNYRTVFSSIFQLLEDNEIIERNFVQSIKQLKSKPQIHKTYTEKEQVSIFKHLEETDPILLLYIKFISYNFLRPVEVCRLKIKDVDLQERTLKYASKTKHLQTKLIPDILFEELPDLTNCKPDDFLFTPKQIGGKWNASEINRRTYFGKRYKKVKQELGFSDDYTMYSFRHTFITKLFKAISKTKTPFEAKSVLMQITGHKTMEALVKYLRDIDAELPNDYSDYLR